MFVGAIAIEGNEQKRSAQNEVQNSDRCKESETFPNVIRTNEQDVADEHLLDFFIAFGGAAEQQNRRRRRDDVGDSDDRFLRNLTRAFAGNGKNRSADERETERDRKRCPTFQIQVEQHRDTNPSEAICAIAMSIKMMPRWTT